MYATFKKEQTANQKPSLPSDKILKSTIEMNEEEIAILSDESLELIMGDSMQVDTTETVKNPSPDSTVQQSQPTPLLPPCRVCGEKASGFHYGANTCEACKGFFRRSIVKIQQNKEEYKCIGSGSNCDIKPGKRSACPLCRYKKCLEVGMSQDAIKTGRYTYEKRTRDTQEVRKLQNQNKPGSHFEVDIIDEDAKAITEALVEAQKNLCPMVLSKPKESQNEIISQIQQRVYDEYITKVELFGSMSAIPSDVYDEFYKQTGLHLDNREELINSMINNMERGVSNMVEIVRLIPGFTELTVEDQTSLIKSSHFEFWYLINFKMMNPELKVFGGCVNAHMNDLKKLFESEHMNELFEFAKTLHALDLSIEEIVLTRGIAVTFRDRCPLQEPEKVEKIQWTLVNCLRWVAKKNDMNPDKRWGQILDRLTALRNLTEISYKCNKIKASWPAMQTHPVLLDLLNFS